MTCDNYGNILTKNGVTYQYDTVWKDKLVKVGNDTITYDAQGNPTSYLGHTLTWEKGRQLKSFDNNAYTYNANGIRTSKTINGVTHTYTLDGAKILREVWGNNVIVPMYDNEDSVCGILYNNVPYYFLKNLQGDVIAIIDKDSETVARYTYDAWGVCTTLNPDGTANTNEAFVGNVNPYRYRSYYYDSEIGLYYLQSRYYDPTVGRFVNADEANCLVAFGGKLTQNAFAYVLNSPINGMDRSGMFSLKQVVEVIQKVTNWISGVLDTLLKKYGISVKRYKRRNRYKKRNDLKNFVFKNKSKIKNMKKSLSTIGDFIDIVMVVVECSDLMKNHKNEFKQIAEILFYGFLKLVSFFATKIISCLVSKFSIFIKYVVENVLEWVFDKYFGSESAFTNKLKNCYLGYVNNTKMSFFDYIIALFKGFGKAIA